jgi:Na+-transporting methylmalonyl-CoA/oxaloacetate decarboxylase gamma subunit
MEPPQMDAWTFGFTLALIGMGGTMLVLWILSLLILLIRKVFPYQPEAPAAKKG